MKIKVCGMRDILNIEALIKLEPDYIGFIFYPESQRYVGEQIPVDARISIPGHIQKVGVFVDEPFEKLVERFRGNRLDMIQLHGSESPDYCQKLKNLDVAIVKAFKISVDFDFKSVKPFDLFCDFYLFDTAGNLPGGTGLKFDWEKLYQYEGNKPFFLGGGIKPDDIQDIKRLSHSRLHAIDVNSGFEIVPGVKNIPKLKLFIDRIHDPSGL